MTNLLRKTSTTFGIFLSVAAVAVAACSSSSNGGLEGDDGGGPSSGSSAGSGSGSGSGSSGSASGKDSGTSSGGDAACGKQVANMVTFTNGKVNCGTPCDLTADTCCVSSVGAAMCVTGHSGCGTFGSPLGAAAFECIQETDCPSGQVCCGYAANGMTGSKCQDVSGNGGKCSPAPSSTQGSVQFCQKSCECKDGSECVAQSCTVTSGVPNANLTMCGLQSQPPYNCTAQ
jgi:hypothetical protein